MKKILMFIFIVIILITGLSISTGCSNMKTEEKTEEITPAEDIENKNYEEAVVGGGCFWGIEAIFEQLKGVKSVESGYAGGSVENPTYEEVCSGNTGHAEVVRITYNPEIISYRQLLEVFFYIHDPTTLNRQGNDSGSQYRSIILFENLEQEQKAMGLIEELERQELYDDPITTEVKPLDTFYLAEEYHQSYYEKNNIQPYCQSVISPKVKKFSGKFGDLLK